jgi:hypothetical protein
VAAGYPEGIPAMSARHTCEQRPGRLEIAWPFMVLLAVLILSIHGAIVPALALIPLLPKSDFYRGSRPK